MDETNVLIFTFSDPSKAYQALSEMKAQPRVEEPPSSSGPPPARFESPRVTPRN